MNRAAIMALCLSIPNVLIPALIYSFGFGMPPLSKQIILGTNSMLSSVLRVPLIYVGLIKTTFKPQNTTIRSTSDYFSHLVPRDQDDYYEASTPNETVV